jgi:ABC-type branched-subunit amino acid transport system substrate-binding protein
MTGPTGNTRKEFTPLFIRTMCSIVLIGLCSAGPLVADQQKDPAAQFDQSIILYRNQRYNEALEVLAKLAEPGARHNQVSKSLLMQIRTLEKLGEWNRAEALADRFAIDYPNSRYMGDLHLIRSRLAWHKGDRANSIRNLLWILDRSTDTQVSAAAEDHLTAMVNTRMTQPLWRELCSEEHSAATAAWLKIWTARAMLGWQRKDEADRLLRELNGLTLTEKQLRLLRAWQATEAANMAYPSRLGIVLPLSGDNANEGHQFLQGFIYALSEKKSAVELVLQDSKSSLIDATRTMIPLLKADVDVIIGDLDGNRSAALAALAAQAGKTYLCPVATDNGIAQLGEQVFQMNSDLETRGAALARYAFEKLGLRTFASIAPADDYGQVLTDAFSSTIDKLGGSIVAQQWYYPGTEDFTRHFQTVRETALKAAPPDTAILNAFARHKKEMAEAGQRTLGSQDDEFEIPVRSIDGFFFPIYEEDISIIAPQYALVNIQSTLLGGDFWNNPDILRSQRRYVNGVVFFSGHYVNETNLEYINFRNRYRIMTAESPSILTVLGYDLGHQVDSIRRAGRLQDGQVGEYLSTAEPFKGMAGTYQFSADSRVNRIVHLLQFKDGNIAKMEP